MTHDTYAAIPAVNFSRLKKLAASPKHYRANHNRDTASRVVLRAMHAAILEPEAFARDFAVCNMRRDERTAAYRAWLDDHYMQQPLTVGEHAEVLAVRDAVLAHPEAARLLAGCATEMTMTWDEGDMPCKGRLDALGAGRIIDLKGYGTTDPREVARAIARGWHHVQAAHYVAGARAQGLAVDRYYLITYETDPPYDVAVFDITSWLGIGERVRQEWLTTLRLCERTEQWPGRCPGVEVLEPPEWMAEEEGEE